MEKSKMEEVLYEKMKLADEDEGCKRIARLQALTLACKVPHCLLRCGEEDFKELLEILRSGDTEDSRELYPDNQIFKYRTVNDIPLKGLVVFGNDKIRVNFDLQDLPEDYMVPEVIELQRNYVVHYMVPMLRRKVFKAMDRMISKVEFETMSSDDLNRMVKVADVLVDSMTETERAELEWDTLKKRIDEIIGSVK